MQNQQSLTPSQEAQPLVSFIVTCYNLPVPMLCECIDSILALSLRPFERELIIVDDGSEVSPMNGLMQYGDQIVYVRQRHGGVSRARNLGIQMSKGAYLQFVDGDDCLLQTPYEHCLDAVRLNNSTEMVVFEFTSSTQFSIFNFQSSIHSSLFKDTLVDSGAEYMLKHNIHGSAWGYLFRRSVLSDLRFTPNIANGEDEEFTAQLMLRAERILVTDAKAYYYRQRPSSAVHQKDDTSKRRRLDDTITVIRKLSMMTDRLSTTDRLAMQKRVAQLTMDYIYNTIILTRSRSELDKRVKELYAEGLFPLPDRNYSKKYVWFRRMTNSPVGRSILLHTLPLMRKER